MKTTVYVVSTCIPERGESPCLPEVFASYEEAETQITDRLRDEWKHNPPYDEFGDPLPFPSGWKSANVALKADCGDGSWGEWQITKHDVIISPVPNPRLWSFLIAWHANDFDSGYYGWSGEADTQQEALAHAYAEMAMDENISLPGPDNCPVIEVWHGTNPWPAQVVA
jgi:hypothetical protein